MTKNNKKEKEQTKRFLCELSKNSPVVLVFGKRKYKMQNSSKYEM